MKKEKTPNSSAMVMRRPSHSMMTAVIMRP